MGLQDEIDRATRRAQLRQHLERHISGLPTEDARAVLLDILVAMPPVGINIISVEPGERSSLHDAGAATAIRHGARAESTYQFLLRTGGATVEQVARAIYGGDDPDARKKAASMLSLLKSPAGGSRAVKDDQTEVWKAVERNRMTTR